MGDIILYKLFFIDGKPGRLSCDFGYVYPRGTPITDENAVPYQTEVMSEAVDLLEECKRDFPDVTYLIVCEKAA
jgi:hypothetical protein